MTARHGPFVGGPVVVGVVNTELRVEHISSNVRSLVGFEPEECVDKAALTAVHPDDQANALWGLAQALETGSSVDLCVRIQHREVEWIAIKLLLVPFGPRGPLRLGFVVMPAERAGEDAGVQERLATLEAMIRRIAMEVRVVASSSPAPAPTPVLDARLTSREMQILDLLVSGQRVPTIARSIFISQSTVRNHLCSIYRKLSVHSQAELLQLLQPARTATLHYPDFSAERGGTGRGGAGSGGGEGRRSAERT